MKRVAILGSTGSIGTQTLDVIRALPDQFQVVGLAAARDSEALKKQAEEFGVKHLALFDPAAAQSIGAKPGIEGITEIATGEDVDVVVVSVAGVIGLVPTVAAIQAKKDIALASKEVLVAAGEWVMPLVREHGINLTPIDSEHSAVWQCCLGARPGQIHSVMLTASGGPFRGKKRDELAAMTPAQALNHPTWNMGGKITIDSATLMNKALEMIEAKWLFDVPMDRVEVVIHPQSIIHSMVRFADGSVLGQMGWPNMRLPIQFALTYPERPPSSLPTWDPVQSSPLTFESVDEETFSALRLARQAEAVGGTMPCTLNAANEVAANAFIRGDCGFLRITEVVEEVMSRSTAVPVTMDSLIETDRAARELAQDLIKAKHG